MLYKKNLTFVAIVPLFIILLAAFPQTSLAADDDVADIFRPSTFGTVPATDDAVRIAYPGTVERVAINFASLALDSPEKAKLVRVSLERNGISFLARCTRLTVGPQGTLTWHGRAVEVGGSVIIAFNEDVAFGQIEVNGRTFKIEPDPATPDHLVFEPNPEFAAPICGGEMVPESLPPAKGSPMPGPGAAITTVDLLILYTNGFAAKYPGNLLGAQINFLVAVMSESLWNSKVNMQVRLVGISQVQFRDTGSLNDPLNALIGQGSAQDNAAFAGVNNLRNQLGADQVSLLRVFDSSNNYCGLAWTWLTYNSNFAGWAYSVVQVGRYDTGGGGYSYCSDQTLAHEMGHNWGLNHNLGDQAIFSYSVGFRFGNGQYMTVMSYRSQGGSEQTVSHYSNPRVRYSGFKTGSKKCNSARSTNTVRQTVAGWRPTVVSQDNKAPKNKTKANFINTGSASTSSSTVTLALFGKDKRGVVGYYASESSATPAAWQAGWIAVATAKKFKRNVQFTLSSGSGVKRVYVWFRDASGNVSKVKSDTITLQ